MSFIARRSLGLQQHQSHPQPFARKKRESRSEVTLHKQESTTWWAFARPARKLTAGDKINFTEEFSADVLDKRIGGEVLLSFQQNDGDVIALLQKYGIMPLPPYIKRPKAGLPGDATDYQTVFAKNEGAVAAPTAGLHFSETLLKPSNRRYPHRLCDPSCGSRDVSTG